MSLHFKRGVLSAVVRLLLKCNFQALIGGGCEVNVHNVNRTLPMQLREHYFRCTPRRRKSKKDNGSQLLGGIGTIRAGTFSEMLLRKIASSMTGNI